MANFDDILKNLHNNSTLSDSDQMIEITAQRTFNVPANYNTVLGYAGDVNSQIVTFKFPLKHEGHNLSECQYKIIKWKNNSSRAEGQSNLQIKSTSKDNWTATWEVPPDVMTAAGNIEIAIEIYDEVYSKIAFSWNTPFYSGFSIGETLTEIGKNSRTLSGSYSTHPAKNEILNIDTNSRSIIAPVGYNYSICNYGEIGFSTIYFEINKYIRNQDLMLGNSEIYVQVSFGEDQAVQDFLISKKEIFVSSSDSQNGKLLLSWDVPESITNNQQNYVGPITIAIKVLRVSYTNLTKRVEAVWSTTPFSGLLINPSLALNDASEFIPREEIIIEDEINKYFQNNFLIIEDFLNIT